MLQFRVAKDLGKTLGELRRTITVYELLLWHTFYELERADAERAQHGR